MGANSACGSNGAAALWGDLKKFIVYGFDLVAIYNLHDDRSSHAVNISLWLTRSWYVELTVQYPAYNYLGHSERCLSVVVPLLAEYDNNPGVVVSQNTVECTVYDAGTFLHKERAEEPSSNQFCDI